MKKFFCFIFTLVLCLSVLMTSGCADKLNLSNHLIELRENIYQGQSENYSLKAAYGFRTSVSDENSTNTEKVSKLSFRLTGKETDDVTYTLKFIYEEQELSAVFAFNALADCLTAAIELENFSLDQFTVTVCAGSDSEDVEMTSILPEGTLTITQALDSLKTKQPDLIESYKDEYGNFSGYIQARIIVKEDKPYWYIGLIKSKDDVKALLIDGITGDVLAIRTVL